MRLLTTGARLDQLAPHKGRLVELLSASLLGSGRDVPVTTAAFRALFDHGPAAFVDRLSGQGLWGHVDRDRLHRELAACIGLDSFAGSARHAPHAYLQERHAVFRDPCLGTVGSGNHFVELQVVDEVLDRHAAYRAGLRAGDVVARLTPAAPQLIDARTSVLRDEASEMFLENLISRDYWIRYLRDRHSEVFETLELNARRRQEEVEDTFADIHSSAYLEAVDSLQIELAEARIDALKAMTRTELAALTTVREAEPQPGPSSPQPGPSWRRDR